MRGCPPPNKEIDRCTTEVLVFACVQHCFVWPPLDVQFPIMAAGQAAIPAAAQPLWQDRRVAEVRTELLAPPAVKAFRAVPRVAPRSYRTPAVPRNRQARAVPRNHRAPAVPRNRRAREDRQAQTPAHLAEVVAPQVLPPPAPSRDPATRVWRAAVALPWLARVEIATPVLRGARQQEEVAERPLAEMRPAEALPVAARPAEMQPAAARPAAARPAAAPARNQGARSSANAASTSAPLTRRPRTRARR